MESIKNFIKESKRMGGFYAEHPSPANGGIRVNGEKFISVGFFLTPEKPLNKGIIENDMRGVSLDMVLNFTPFQKTGDVAPATWSGTLFEILQNI